MRDIAPGDVVKLKGSTQAMTVEDVERISDIIFFVSCAWFDTTGALCRDRFRAYALTLVEVPGQ